MSTEIDQMTYQRVDYEEIANKKISELQKKLVEKEEERMKILVKHELFNQMKLDIDSNEEEIKGLTEQRDALQRQ
jgi:hypothetical protein